MILLIHIQPAEYKPLLYHVGVITNPIPKPNHPNTITIPWQFFLFPRSFYNRTNGPLALTNGRRPNLGCHLVCFINSPPMIRTLPVSLYLSVSPSKTKKNIICQRIQDLQTLCGTLKDKRKCVRNNMITRFFNLYNRYRCLASMIYRYIGEQRLWLCSFCVFGRHLNDVTNQSVK